MLKAYASPLSLKIFNPQQKQKIQGAALCPLYSLLPTTNIPAMIADKTSALTKMACLQAWLEPITAARVATAPTLPADLLSTASPDPMRAKNATKLQRHITPTKRGREATQQLFL
ncbi:MAG: hypothetical protein NTV81_03885, partial [Candidatus Komeilibacteria bacterium]|nr:hypothetical protein [Candidatus Komeilibacteria bacterium]